MAQVSIHRVKAVHADIKRLDDPPKTYVRHLFVTTDDGEQLDLLMFADDVENLKVQAVPDASAASRELKVEMQAAALEAAR